MAGSKTNNEISTLLAHDLAIDSSSARAYVFFSRFVFFSITRIKSNSSHSRISHQIDNKVCRGLQLFLRRLDLCLNFSQTIPFLLFIWSNRTCFNATELIGNFLRVRTLCVLLHIISIIQWFWNPIWEKKIQRNVEICF